MDVELHAARALGYPSWHCSFPWPMCVHGCSRDAAVYALLSAPLPEVALSTENPHSVLVVCTNTDRSNGYKWRHMRTYCQTQHTAVMNDRAMQPYCSEAKPGLGHHNSTGMLFWTSLTVIRKNIVGVRQKQLRIGSIAM